MWGEDVKNYWHAHGARIIVMFGIALLVILAVGRRWAGKKGTSTPGLKVLEWKEFGRKEPKKSFSSSGEKACKTFLESAFKRPFLKARPDFLRNNVTGVNLELDCFNEELGLAVEYNGQQHYRYTPFFHKNKEAFQNQKYRDETKRRLCRENGIVLIEVPYSVKDIENFLVRQIKEKYTNNKTHVLRQQQTGPGNSTRWGSNRNAIRVF